MDLKPVSGRKGIKRVFRMTRVTLIEWIPIQPGISTYAFVECEKGRTACVMDLWGTLVGAVETPWPDGRGPLRRGRRNPLSRD